MIKNNEFILKKVIPLLVVIFILPAISFWSELIRAVLHGNASIRIITLFHTITSLFESTDEYGDRDISIAIPGIILYGLNMCVNFFRKNELLPVPSLTPSIDFHGYAHCISCYMLINGQSYHTKFHKLFSNKEFAFAYLSQKMKIENNSFCWQYDDKLEQDVMKTSLAFESVDGARLEFDIIYCIKKVYYRG